MPNQEEDGEERITQQDSQMPNQEEDDEEMMP